MPTAALLNQQQQGLDDGAGDWWGGIQQSALSAVLAIALSVAAIGTSSRQVFGWQQDEVSQAVADEAFWQNPVAPTSATLYQNLPYLPDSEEIPAGSLHGQPDEDFWQNPTAPVAATLGPVYLPDPEEIPAAQLSATVDEYYWQNEVAPIKATLGSLYLPDPEEIPSGNLSATVDEYFWVNSVPPIFSYSILTAFSYDDVIVPQVAAFVPDEDFWANSVLSVSQAFVVPSLNIDSQEPTLFGQFDEDFWQNSVQPVQATLVWPQQFTFDVQEPSGSLFGQFDEDFWQNAVQPVQAVLAWPQQFTFDVQEPAGSLFGQFDEDFWTNPVLPVISQVPIQAFRDDDVVVPQVIVFGFDEDFWQNPAVSTKAIFAPLYQPDPEEVPAGSLVPPAPPVPPIFQPLIVGKTLRSFGVSLSSPVTIQTTSNDLQLFQTNGTPYLIVPADTNLYQRSYRIVAGGSIMIPPSGINTAVNFALTLKGFSQRTQPARAIVDDVMATLPSPQATSGTSLWQLVVKLSAAQDGNTGPALDKRAGRLTAEWMININGVYTSGISISNQNPFQEALLYFSLGAQFTGSVSGADKFQANLYQFETQQ
jgi:hypothetical protein